MSEPVTFSTNKRNGRIAALLGDQVVGEIEPWHGDHSGNYGCYYWITLTDGGERDICHPAPTLHDAKWLLLQRLGDWFAQAGPFCAALSQALAQQAGRERPNRWAQRRAG